MLAVLVVGLWVGAIWRCATAKTPQSQAFSRSVLALAAAATIYIPAVSTAITDATTIGMASVLLYLAAAVAAIEMLQFMLWTTHPQAAARTSAVPRMMLITALTLTLALAVVVGHPSAANLAQPWASPEWQAVFWASWLMFVAVALGRMLAVCLSYARRSGPSPLRTSTILLAAAAASGLAYAVARVIAWMSQDSWHTAAISGAFVVLLLAFLAAASLWALVARIPAVRTASDWKAINRLRPLWELLQTTNPSVALSPLPDKRPSDGVTSRLALYRADVEIRDWMYGLAAYVDDTTWQRCHDTETGSSLHQKEVRATTQWLKVALTSYLSGTHPGPTATCPPVREDIDADVRLLSDVAAQLKDHPIPVNAKTGVTV